MAGERTYPILPCVDVDEIIAFYELLGFKKTFRQIKPYACAVVERGDIGLHFFGLANFKPADSYGSCILTTPDADELYRAFAAGLRAKFGKLPAAGIPRMTRPRKRQQAVYGFSLIDPGGNWIRVSQQGGKKTPADENTSAADAPETGLARVLVNAVTLGDSKGDPATAAKLLDTTLAKNPTAPSVERLPLMIYRAQLALAMDDPSLARQTVEKIKAIELSKAERTALQSELEELAEIEGEFA